MLLVSEHNNGRAIETTRERQIILRFGSPMRVPHKAYLTWSQRNWEQTRIAFLYQRLRFKSHKYKFSNTSICPTDHAYTPKSGIILLVGVAGIILDSTVAWLTSLDYN
jgi:hypothetical protein